MHAHRIIRLLQGQYFVYCAQMWQRATALAALRIPVTSPPVTAETFMPRWMEGKRVLIFKLHGYPDNPNWYGMDRHGDRVLALTPALVQCADLTGAIVIAIVCYGIGGAMQKAFFDAGACAFFGSPQEVRGREGWPGEADRLVSHLLRRLGAPQDLPRALTEAKALYHCHRRAWSEHDQFTLDTFMLVTPEGEKYA